MPVARGAAAVLVVLVVERDGREPGPIVDETGDEPHWRRLMPMCMSGRTISTGAAGFSAPTSSTASL